MPGNQVRLANGQLWTKEQFADHYLRHTRSGEPAPVDVDMSWYMGDGPGRYYHPGMFPIITSLIDRRDHLAPGTYDLWHLAPDGEKDASVKALTSHYALDPHSGDYTTRALVFGNESARISGRVTVNQDGSKAFHGIEIRPFDTDFDFAHNTWNIPLEAGRALARRIYDPENQGVKYKVRYRGPWQEDGTGRFYEPFSDSQLSEALTKEFLSPGKAPPGLLPSVTGKAPILFTNGPFQSLDQPNGDQPRSVASDRMLPVAPPQTAVRPGVVATNWSSYPARKDPVAASVSDPNTPAARFALPGSLKLSGDTADWIASLAGVDPQNSNQVEPPAQADQLRGFYRDDPSQPWFVQRPR
jgi:hypothetical protein